MADPAVYTSSFSSLADPELEDIWYGCAYTTQLCSIARAQGRNYTAPTSGWNNSVLVGVGNTLLVNGAKRDRTVWPGDMGLWRPRSPRRAM